MTFALFTRWLLPALVSLLIIWAAGAPVWALLLVAAFYIWAIGEDRRREEQKR